MTPNGLQSADPAFARELRAALIESASKGRLSELLQGLSAPEVEAITRLWPVFARPDQLPPDGDWSVWLMIGGRGAGKTRAGAEWVRGAALGRPPFAATPMTRIALVGETLADVRDVMIEGESGLLAIHPRHERPTWKSSKRKLEWPNGATALVFSAEDPESLRGPQFACAWSDELAKWTYAQETWDMLQFGLRLGESPRQVVTTTPRSIPILKELMASNRTAVTRAGTRMNAANLAPNFLDGIVGRYAGTRLGRQELDGEIIDERADALWSRDAIDRMRLKSAPPLERIVVAVDPPVTSGKKADRCGIVVAGIDTTGRGIVLKDGTVAQARPAQWANRAIALYRRFDADVIVAEVNQGGEMVAQVLREVDDTVPIKSVRATRGKWLRAEPVAALYEQSRVHHVGNLPELEDEMCDFGTGGLSSGRSPDRLDALVWALTDLMLGNRGEPKARFV